MKERAYEPSDLVQVMEVFRASIHSLAAPYYTPEQLAAWAPASADAGRWQQRLAPLQTLVAEDDGVIAGFVSYELNGHLDLLFTHPAFSRRGVATRLCQHVESALRRAAVSKIFVEVSLAARPFFDHHGFEVDKEESVECRGVYLRRFAMHKRL